MADERTSGIYPLHELDDLQIAANDVDPARLGGLLRRTGSASAR
jgi:hypothetical protein